ncbi:type II toxin-antitoxin system VapB family antitoxin [Aeromicrobium sp. CTD01-1L150]|uniref:type II toxin-antitoxin system VapB family antitoxin n=1 Tax=Aeromicrobium sp. CTD01-1L150 TaxID=3341830 RepID=UPI0035BF2781
MAITSIDLDKDQLEVARQLTGATSNREVVEYALDLLIAQKRQVEVVEDIIAMGPGDVDAPVIHYDLDQ